MQLNNSNTTEVIFNKIERETEKAYLINFPVSWNANIHPRSFWIPKSCVMFYKQTIGIADFLIRKLERDNAFKGYEMRFEIAKIA